MKKKIFIVSVMIIIIFICVLYYINVSVFSNEFKVISEMIENAEEMELEDAIKLMKETSLIYVCNQSDNLYKTCSKDNLIKVEKKKENIDKIVNEISKLEVLLDEHMFVKDIYTLYFIDDNNKIICSADFSYHLILKLSNDIYYMDTESNEYIKDILGLSYENLIQ